MTWKGFNSNHFSIIHACNNCKSHFDRETTNGYFIKTYLNRAFAGIVVNLTNQCINRDSRTVPSIFFTFKRPRMNLRYLNLLFFWIEISKFKKALLKIIKPFKLYLRKNDKNFKFCDGDGPNLCRENVSSTFIENIFRSGLTLVSSWDCFCHKDKKLTKIAPMLCCRNPLTVFEEKLEPKIVVIFLKTKLSPFNI